MIEDNLLRIFGSDKIKGIMERIGIEEGEHIESRMVTRAVENAQKKVESMHFESRNKSEVFWSFALICFKAILMILIHFL